MDFAFCVNGGSRNVRGAPLYFCVHVGSRNVRGATWTLVISMPPKVDSLRATACCRNNSFHGALSTVHSGGGCSLFVSMGAHVM